MGLDFNGIQFMLYAKKIGVNFEKTGLIGRQGLHIKKYDFLKILAEYNYHTLTGKADEIFFKQNRYAEEFFSSLGAEEIHSFDKSDYEKATYLLDFNDPMPGKFKNQYSVVIDSGSLEHVFNFPVAIKNCMEMVKVGGYFIGITPANNFMGHGFYQFSPELFYSLFNEKTGYKIIDIFIFEDDRKSSWFSVKSPICINKRVTLINNKPAYLAFIAQRNSYKDILQYCPQQSDFVSMWNFNFAADNSKKTSSPNNSLTKISLKLLILRILPDRLKKILKNLLIKRSLKAQIKIFSKEFYKPVAYKLYK